MNALQTAGERGPSSGQRPQGACQGVGWAVDTAKPLLSRTCSFPGAGRGPLASLWLPHLTQAPTPASCLFLPPLSLRASDPLQEQEAWQKLLGGLPEYFIELDRKALASCIPGTT